MLPICPFSEVPLYSGKYWWAVNLAILLKMAYLNFGENFNLADRHMHQIRHECINWAVYIAIRKYNSSPDFSECVSVQDQKIKNVKMTTMEYFFGHHLLLAMCVRVCVCVCVHLRVCVS